MTRDLVIRELDTKRYTTRVEKFQQSSLNLVKPRLRPRALGKSKYTMPDDTQIRSQRTFKVVPTLGRMIPKHGEKHFPVRVFNHSNDQVDVSKFLPQERELRIFFSPWITLDLIGERWVGGTEIFFGPHYLEFKEQRPPKLIIISINSFHWSISHKSILQISFSLAGRSEFHHPQVLDYEVRSGFKFGWEERGRILGFACFVCFVLLYGN